MLSNDWYKRRRSYKSTARHKFCQISDEGRTLLKTASKCLGPSAHRHYRILEVAGTIADQVGIGATQLPHLAAAMWYRSLD